MASYKHILILIHGIYRYYYMNKVKKKKKDFQMLKILIHGDYP